MSHNEELKNTMGSASMIGLMALFGAAVGFVLQLLVAYYFGASGKTDAYFMATSTSDLLSKLLMGGSITAVFLPMFVSRVASGRRDEAWSMALNLLHITSLIFLVFIGLIAIFARQFVALIAPGFDAPTFNLTVSLLYVVLPSFWLLFLVDLTVSMLHALQQFTIPALLRVVAPATYILAILLVVHPLGIYAMAIGATGGAFIQLCLVSWGLYRKGFRYRFIFHPADPAIRHLVNLTYPFLLSVVVTQGAGIVYRILVSNLTPGSLSSLKFAEKITQLITIIFLNSVTTVIYPLLSKKASQSDVIGMRETVGSAIRLTTFVTVPIIIGVALLRVPLVTMIYRHGSFTPEAVSLTATALFFFVIGLATTGISSILGHTVLAFQATRAAVAITIASQVVAICLFVWLVPLMAHAGLALASALVPISSGLLYFLFLGRYIPELWRVFWHTTFAKIAVLGVALFVSISLVLPFVPSIGHNTMVNSIIHLIIPTAVGMLVFFGGAALWNVHEMTEVLALANRTLGKFKRLLPV